MLHMVVNTHAPLDCAFRGEREDELLSGAFDALEGAGSDDKLEVRGAWVNRAAHEIFILAEAPDAHSIERALLTAGLVGRTHSRILPIVDVDQA
jgi:hypothetical protein